MAYTPLTETQITEQLAQVPGWERNGGKITRVFKFDKYLDGTAFACAIGTIAEGINHHPDLMIGYKRVEVSFATHDANHSLTEKDFDAARAMNALGYPKTS
jgi:4a-hydroxytetrahydrobiopterin dehydratase